MMPEREMMPSPPSGLCACRVGDDYVHIAAISPRSVILRLPEGKLPSGALTLQLYLPEEGRYEAHTVSNYTAGEVQRREDAVLLRLCFDDPACAAAIRRTMNAYARFLETKSTLGASAWANAVSGYPEEQDEVFLPGISQQMHAWFDSFPALPWPDAGISLAVELNCPELWQAYLAHPLAEFMEVYAHLRCLREDLLPARLPDRIYIGNSFCRHLFPDSETLSALCRKAADEHLHVTITSAEMRAGEEANADRIIAFARETGAELMVNDWGVLHRARGKCSLLLGPLLNKRRKDPRFIYKPGMDGNLLKQNSICNDAWRDYLASLGVNGYAWDSCSLPDKLPMGVNCLHLPFYQTNTSLWCPLQALCLRGDRGMQQPSDDCPHFCEKNALLYPAHLNMIGRWNSIFALNGALSEPEMRRFDRWVLNF